MVGTIVKLESGERIEIIPFDGKSCELKITSDGDAELLTRNIWVTQNDLKELKSALISIL